MGKGLTAIGICAKFQACCGSSLSFEVMKLTNKYEGALPKNCSIAASLTLRLSSNITDHLSTSSYTRFITVLHSSFWNTATCAHQSQGENRCHLH